MFIFVKVIVLAECFNEYCGKVRGFQWRFNDEGKVMMRERVGVIFVQGEGLMVVGLLGRISFCLLAEDCSFEMLGSIYLYLLTFD